MEKITVEATIENLSIVNEMIDRVLEENECPVKIQMMIDMAVEEIYVNIASYAYAPGKGEAAVSIEIADDPKRAIITFEDSGVPYDPLKKPDPDVTLSAEERQIGGLGIYMVKKSMSEVNYSHTDGRNVLTIVKNFVSND
ncbi:MAG: ATP-binding protein [Lachnospiraceae bacterium]|nr:ATP-binding protein [Lachnospiraceae bacterium]